MAQLLHIRSKTPDLGVTKNSGYDVLKIWRITDSINKSVNDEVVCRTASATPDLLKIARIKVK